MNYEWSLSQLKSIDCEKSAGGLKGFFFFNQKVIRHVNTHG